MERELDRTFCLPDGPPSSARCNLNGHMRTLHDHSFLPGPSSGEPVLASSAAT